MPINISPDSIIESGQIGALNSGATFPASLTNSMAGGEHNAPQFAGTTQAAGRAVRGLLYIVDDQRRLLSIDVATHQVNFIAQLSVLMGDIAIAPDGTAYGISLSYAGLYRINLTTGALQPLDATHVRGGNALAIDALGQAYIATSQSSAIYASALFPAGGTPIGNDMTGRASAGDLTLLGGRLYLSTTDGRIEGFNLPTGALISSGMTGGTDISGLATYEGQAYAFANRTLYSIDLVTGALTNPFTFAAETVGVIYGAASYDFGQSGSALLGGSADESLSGTERDDVLNGADGVDYLSGGAGDDVLYGGDGDDILEGGAGADVLNGWGSYSHVDDTAAYTTQVTANLRDPSQNTGDAAGDTYIMIRNLSGSAFDDVLTCGAYGDLHGNGGNDLLIGGMAENSLLGGAGDDQIIGDAGDDTIDGGSGDDILIVSGAFSDYRLLMNGDDFILKGPDGGDRLTGVESIRFGDGRVLELNRMYGPDVHAQAWADGRIPEALLSDGTGDWKDLPLVLPGIGDPHVGPGKGGADPQVLPGDRWAGKQDDAPLVLPGADDWLPGNFRGFDGSEVLPGHTPIMPHRAALLARLSGPDMAVDDQGGVPDPFACGGWGPDGWGF